MEWKRTHKSRHGDEGALLMSNKQHEMKNWVADKSEDMLGVSIKGLVVEKPAQGKELLLTIFGMMADSPLEWTGTSR